MSGKSSRIMVVDDDSAMLFTVTEILEDAGFEVCGVEDGFQAIELASNEDFALVFMDINLPDIDGVEAYRRIKTVSPGTPVIMMTGFSVESLISQAMEEGAYTVLYKPLDITGLLVAANEALDLPCVLVVDDEPDTRESVKMIFEDIGYQVALAGSGSQAIEHAESQHYDVILMDISMPGMDGFEACRRIVENDPSAKVVFITGHEVNQYAREALIAGAFSLLSKPVDPEDMIALVSSLVDGSEDSVSGVEEVPDVISY